MLLDIDKTHVYFFFSTYTLSHSSQGWIIYKSHRPLLFLKFIRSTINIMMMMSAPSSSFHDVSTYSFLDYIYVFLSQYLSMDSCLPKMEAMTPIQTTDDHFDEKFDNNNSNNITNNKNSVVKRPMNAFLLWARGERKRVSSDGYGVSQTSLSKLLGETWR